MKLGLKVAGSIAVILIVIWILSQAFNLLNMPNDIGVIIGVGIVLAIIVGLFAVGEAVIKKLKKRAESAN